MCLSCGCKQPNEQHGDDRHIVLTDLEKAATASEISVKDVVKNIQEGFEVSAKEPAVAAAQGQTN